MGTSVADVKLDGLDTSMINTLGVNIANIKVGANSAGVAANAPTMAIADLKVGNNVAGVKNALPIDVASNCLKKTRRIDVRNFLR